MEIEYLADNPEMTPRIARWYFNEWGFEVSGNSYELTVKNLYGKLNKDRFPLPIVAIDNNELLGTAQLKVREMEIFPEREHWLGSVYVSSKAREKGVATALVKHIIQMAKNYKIKKLWLQTEALDGGLYKILGWHPVDRLNYDGHDIVVMKKNIYESDS